MPLKVCPSFLLTTLSPPHTYHTDGFATLPPLFVQLNTLIKANYFNIIYLFGTSCCVLDLTSLGGGGVTGAWLPFAFIAREMCALCLNSVFNKQESIVWQKKNQQQLQQNSNTRNHYYPFLNIISETLLVAFSQRLPSGKKVKTSSSQTIKNDFTTFNNKTISAWFIAFTRGYVGWVQPDIHNIHNASPQRGVHQQKQQQEQQLTSGRCEV